MAEVVAAPTVAAQIVFHAVDDEGPFRFGEGKVGHGLISGSGVGVEVGKEEVGKEEEERRKPTPTSKNLLMSLLLLLLLFLIFQG